METTNELGIESELEALVSESKIMRQKQLQMKKFLGNNHFSFDKLEHGKFLVERQQQKTEIEQILSELEQEKKETPAILEFFYLFQEMQTHFTEAVTKEKKLGDTFREVVTGKNNQKSFSWPIAAKTTSSKDFIIWPNSTRSATKFKSNVS